MQMPFEFELLPVCQTTWQVELLLTVTSAVPEYVDPSKFVPATVYLPPTSAANTAFVNIIDPAKTAKQCLKLMVISPSSQLKT
jgi:hypothetical protein